jgi:hypothetical protein
MQRLVNVQTPLGQQPYGEENCCDIASPGVAARRWWPPGMFAVCQAAWLLNGDAQPWDAQHYHTTYR